jgi:hypothetical protein
MITTFLASWSFVATFALYLLYKFQKERIDVLQLAVGLIALKTKVDLGDLTDLIEEDEE